MGIYYIDGMRLRNALVAGAQRVIQLQEQLNNINVFPVPDGDTGTNMALTLRSVADGVLNNADDRLGPVSMVAAESALLGARGNSGAILAQFFQGLAESFEGCPRAKLAQFAQAVKRAAQRAREAIAEPKEGTILTVLQDWAASVQARCQHAADFSEVLSKSLEAAKKSLQTTPLKLKVLAKAGVVDAGAQGFIHLLEGVSHFIKTGKIESLPYKPDEGTAARARIEEKTEDITFRFCTECFVRNCSVPPGDLRARLEAMGNSLIVAGSTQHMRIHIHTNDPQAVFKIVGSAGEIAARKFDDMWAQHASAHGRTKGSDIAIITDSSCDLPAEYLIVNKIRVVPLNLSFGSETYLDRVTMTSEEFYRKLQSDPVHPRTSQPAPAEFKHAFELANETHEEAVAILLSGGVSGTYQAGVTAANLVKGMKIEVIDSRGVSGIIGLLVMVAAEAIREGQPLETVKRRVLEARDLARMFISVATMEYLVRGGRVSRMRGLLANALNLRPILSFSPEGKAVAIAKTRAGRPNLQKTLDLVKARAQGLRDLRFIVCHAAADEAAAFFASSLQRHFGIKDIPVLQISPAVGAHAGPGTAAISFLGYPEEARP